jgi:ADP-heptose:LPS heptosyltransferase
MLLIRTDRLGETLLNLPLAAALKAAFPEASLTLLVQSDFVPLLSGVPWLNRVMGCAQAPERWWVRAWQLGKTLRAGQFDLAVVSNPRKDVHVAAWLAGIPWRVGYDRKWGCLLTHRVADRKALGERHEVEYNLDLARALGVTPTLRPWQLPRFEPEQTEAVELLERQGLRASGTLIAVHPWSSNPRKQWPTERYEALIRGLVERHALSVVVIGGPEEEGQARRLALPRGRAVSLVGRLSLRGLAGMLQRVRVLVSNDSGPVHVAAAVGTRTVVLFGTSDAAAGPRRWGPWGHEHVVIWKSSMEAITVDEVLAAVERQLA